MNEQTNELNDQPCLCLCSDRDNRAAQDTNETKKKAKRKKQKQQRAAAAAEIVSVLFCYFSFFFVVVVVVCCRCRLFVVVTRCSNVCVYVVALYDMCRFSMLGTRAAAAVAITSTCSAVQLSHIYFGSFGTTHTQTHTYSHSVSFVIYVIVRHTIFCVISVSFDRGR